MPDRSREGHVLAKERRMLKLQGLLTRNAAALEVDLRFLPTVKSAIDNSCVLSTSIA